MSKKKISGLAYPVEKKSPAITRELRKEDLVLVPPRTEPVPVVLNTQTFVKLISWLALPLMGVVSASLYFYWQTTVHMDNQVIHLNTGEREKLENKEEAKQSRKKIVQEIKQHQEVQIRELRVEQKEQIQKLGSDLKRTQRREIRSLIQEIRRGRHH